jgi:hypothetical protein
MKSRLIHVFKRVIDSVLGCNICFLCIILEKGGGGGADLFSTQHQLKFYKENDVFLTLWYDIKLNEIQVNPGL